MMRNENVGCTVSECKHHSNEGQCCTLKQIKVVKHGGLANSVEQTDCGSFELKR